LEITDDAQAVEITENVSMQPEDEPPEIFGLPEPITTSIPLVGNGPHWRREFEGVLPPYRGNCSMQAESMEPNGCIMKDPWFGIISQVTVLEPNLGFCLHFDTWTWVQNQTTYLSIQTPRSTITCDNWDFVGRGKIAGSEKYLMGENCNRELVVYRFDR
jgi:hypothetical protein